MEKIGRNDPCWCGSGKKYKTCHMAMDEKIHHYELMGHIVPTHDMLKTAEQIEGIRESSKINVAVLDAVGRETKPAARHLPDRRSHYKGNLWDKAAARKGGRFVCFEEGENHSPWAIMAVEIFLKAALSLPAIRSYPRPYSSAAAAEAS